MVGYYARRAREYERIYHKPERQEDLRWLREFMERTFAGRRVIELACGTGYWTEVIGRVADSVVATDLNEEVLAVARTKPLDPAKVTLLRADAYALPAFPERFTAGLAVFWWSHVPKARLAEFLREFHRVLAPGALVVFVDNSYVEGSSTPVSRTDAFGNAWQIRRLDDGSSHEVLKNFPTDEELRAIVQGMATGVQVRRLRHYWVLSYVPAMD